jgi:hypothetical protein
VKPSPRQPECPLFTAASTRFPPARAFPFHNLLSVASDEPSLLARYPSQQTDITSKVGKDSERQARFANFYPESAGAAAAAD